MGNDSGMLAGTFGEYDEDDKEADEIWDSVDQHMDLRRRVSSENAQNTNSSSRHTSTHFARIRELEVS